MAPTNDSSDNDRKKIKEGDRDQLKGSAKKTVGEATGNDSLKREGQIDKTKGKAKNTVDKAADQFKD